MALGLPQIDSQRNGAELCTEPVVDRVEFWRHGPKKAARHIEIANIDLQRRTLKQKVHHFVHIFLFCVLSSYCENKDRRKNAKSR